MTDPGKSKDPFPRNRGTVRVQKSYDPCSDKKIEINTNAKAVNNGTNQKKKDDGYDKAASDEVQQSAKREQIFGRKNPTCVISKGTKAEESDPGERPVRRKGERKD